MKAVGQAPISGRSLAFRPNSLRVFDIQNMKQDQLRAATMEESNGRRASNMFVILQSQLAAHRVDTNHTDLQ